MLVAPVEVDVNVIVCPCGGLGRRVGERRTGIAQAGAATTATERRGDGSGG